VPVAQDRLERGVEARLRGSEAVSRPRVREQLVGEERVGLEVAQHGGSGNEAVGEGAGVAVVEASLQGDELAEQGEILVKGPNVFQGYWNDAEATRACIDDDGWLHTGDIAMVDDEGFLFLVDRAKDLIIVSGFNVFPAEVEEVLLEMDEIREVAVVGVAHPHTGEAVKAFVVVGEGYSLEEDSVIEFAAQRLARYKCPQKVNFVDELPLNLSGKVLRRALR